MFQFFTGIALEGVTMMTDITKYLDFVLKMFFAFGIAFEVPIATILVILLAISMMLAAALPDAASGSKEVANAKITSLVLSEMAQAGSGDKIPVIVLGNFGEVRMWYVIPFLNFLIGFFTNLLTVMT